MRVFECYIADSSTHLVCPQKSGVEVLHTVDLSDSNTEVVTRYSTDISTEGRFYTDSNGFGIHYVHNMST